MQHDIDQITDVAKKYFDALYFGDTELFAEVFHPEAVLFSNVGDEYISMTVPEYLDLVAGRENPGDRNDERSEEILGISVASPTTAHLRVREVFKPKLFTDELVLMKHGQKWKIVAKIWHFDLLQNAERRAKLSVAAEGS